MYEYVPYLKMGETQYNLILFQNNAKVDKYYKIVHFFLFFGGFGGFSAVLITKSKRSLTLVIALAETSKYLTASMSLATRSA